MLQFSCHVIGCFERSHRKSLAREQCSMKFVKPLSPDDITQLKALSKTSTTFRMRQRAHAMLLSAQGYKIDLLADIFDVERDTMRPWMNNWEGSGIVGLSAHATPGRPPKMSAQEEEHACKIILESPQPLKVAIPQIEAQLGKKISRDGVTRLVKKSLSLEERSAILSSPTCSRRWCTRLSGSLASMSRLTSPRTRQGDCSVLCRCIGVFITPGDAGCLAASA
jgi:transposase